MPIITPPKDDDYPEPEREEPTPTTWEEYRRIQLFLDIVNWICPECQATNFGRNKYCAYCWGRHSKRTPRPVDFVNRRKSESI